MMGSIIGDIAGSRFEFAGFKTDNPYSFELFGESVDSKEALGEVRILKPGKGGTRTKSQTTDDTVLTCAVMETLMGRGSYEENFVRFGQAWPTKGYGGNFAKWVNNPDRQPYNSCGNGAMMKVGPVGYCFDTVEETRAEAVKSAMPTHNHPEGIKGAESVAAATFLARTGASKDEIRECITREFGYDLSRSIEEIRKTSDFEVRCQGTAPQVFAAFFDSTDYEHAIRLAISLGADADTVAAITGGIAEAFYGGVPEKILKDALPYVEPEFQQIVVEFAKWLVERAKL